MSATEQIRKAIRSMVEDMIPVTFRVAKVVSVDKIAQTCTVTLVKSDLELDEVLLSINETEDWLVYPKVGSRVFIGIVENEKTFAFVSQVSEVDDIKWRGGGHGGLVIVGELVNKINRLEDRVNSLISRHNSHIHTTTATIGSGPTVGVIAPTTNQETSITPNTQVSDLENDKITHG